MNEKYFDLFLKIFGVIAFLYSLTMILLPQFIFETHFANPPGSNAYIVIEGWGTTLLGLSAISFFGSNLDLKAKLVISRGIFIYFAPLAALWLIDMLARGIVLIGAMTYGLIIIFAFCGGFFGFLFKS